MRITLRGIATGFVLVAVSAFGAEPTVLTSKVSQVTVYPQWAYVTRSSTVKMEAGTHQFVLDHLPAWIDEESLRVRLESDADFVISGAEASTVYLEQFGQDEVRKAQEAVTAVRDAIENLQVELAVLAAGKAYYNNLAVWKLDKVPHESAAREVKPDELAGVSTFISEHLLDNARRTLKLSREIRRMEPELQAREKEWQNLRSRAQLEQKRITVTVAAAEPTSGELHISYLISGASWYPAYDVRTDADRRAVEFAGAAIIQQSTGEDWADARFSLSTVQPYLVREKPQLEPWFVTASWDLQTLGNNMPEGANFRLSKSQSTTVQMERIQQKQSWYQEANPAAFANVRLNLDNALEVVRQVEERGSTIEFSVPGEFTVKSDGTPVAMAMGEVTLTPQRRYSAIPSVSGSTYLTGEMRNNGSFPFLPGPVKVYVGGSLIGKSRINFVAEGEKFELFLGLEERIKVTRRIDASKTSSTLFGDRKRLTVSYRIEVTNFLDTAAVVDISDQIPVSQEDTIKVRTLDVSPKTEKPEKGILQWELEVAPRGTQAIRFEFQVEYPANAELGNASELVRQIDFAL